MNDGVLVHFILKNKLHKTRTTNYVPEIGDEIRLSKNEFYMVEKRVWCYDEMGSFRSRVNIEISKINVV